MSKGFVGFEVREARATDAPLVSALCMQLGYSVGLDAAQERLERARVSEDGMIAVAASKDDWVVGWLEVGERYSLASGRRAQLLGLVVDERFRRHGVGRALVDAAARWARERGHRQLETRSNAARNGAHAFYPGLGFRLTKTQRCYVRDLDSP